MIVLLTVTNFPVWRYVPVEGVMANVYYPESVELAAEFRGRLWVDSGGFQAIARGEVLPLSAVLYAYRRIEAEAHVAPDVPSLPSDPPDVAEAKMEISYRRYVEASKELEVVPVVHVYRDLSLTRRYAKRYLDHSPPRLAVGGAVPYLLNRAEGGAAVVYSFIEELRAEYKGWIHVLGAGAPTVAKRLAELGVDSSDTATWAVKAAYGKVLLPCGPERHVTRRRKRFGGKPISPKELEELEAFLKRAGFPYPVPACVRASWCRAVLNAFVIQYMFMQKNPSCPER